MSQVTLKGEAVSIGGTFPAPGSVAPDFLLANIKREDVSLNDYAGKKKILNIFLASIHQPVLYQSNDLMMRRQH